MEDRVDITERCVRVTLEKVPDHYEGFFPSVTIRYKDKDEAERLKSSIEELTRKNSSLIGGIR